jgi:hypothetical protein
MRQNCARWPWPDTGGYPDEAIPEICEGRAMLVSGAADELADAGRMWDLLHYPGDVREVRAPKAGKFKTVSGYFDNREAFCASLQGFNNDRKFEIPGIYVTLNPVNSALLARSYNRVKFYVQDTTADKDISKIRWLPIDIDAIRPAGISASEEEHAAALDLANEIEKRLLAAGWPAQAIIKGDSGNGAHLLIRIEDLDNTKESKELIKRCIEAMGKEFSNDKTAVDTTTHNPARIWKIYGTIARKGDNTPDRPHRLAKIISAPEPGELTAAPRPLLEALALLAGDNGNGSQKATKDQTTTESQGGDSSFHQSIREMDEASKFNVPEYIKKHGAGILRERDNGPWHVWELAVCPFNPQHIRGEAYISQHQEGQIAFKCQHNRCADKDWPTLRALWEPERAARLKAQAEAAASMSGKVMIKVNDRLLPEVTSETLTALEDQNFPPRIFKRMGSLVRLQENGSGLVIEPLSIDILSGELGDVAGFYAGHNGKNFKEFPPLRVVRTILAMGEWPGIPELKGIIETPVIRPDGSILSEPGYDEATMLYFNPIVDLSGVKIPEELTQKHAEKSAEWILNEVFGDFPFENNASRTNILAMLLSIIARPLIKGNVPLTIIDKPQPGTGAGLIVDIISMITTGTKASMWGMPGSDEEWRKAITSALMSGKPVIVIDNVDGKLRSGNLARALTAGFWEDRLLGKNIMARLPQEAIWIATGNNIQIGGDLARRSIWSRLDANMARPYERVNFKHPDILAWIREEHDRILAYLLIMIRAWALAGMPLGSARLGSFEEWAKVISGILEYAGVEDLMGNATKLYEEMDVEAQEWDAFLIALQRHYRDEPFLSSRLKEDLSGIEMRNADILNAAPDSIMSAMNKGKAVIGVGVELRKHLNQVSLSGLKLTQVMDTHSKVNLWKVAGSPKD